MNKRTESASRKITTLHLETTDVCQAACPQCSRETDLDFDPTQQHHLDVAGLTRAFPKHQIADLNKVFACGNYGDPAAGRHTMEIFRYVRSVNTTATLGMNTNGGLRNPAWWYDLAQLFNQPNDYVVFSIDGLENTNHIYRVGVNWSHLMSNVRSFIAGGGRAHWDMLVYAHNHHQVSDCEKLARDLGFAWFRTKVTRRSLTPGLSLPDHVSVNQDHSGQIDCHVLREQSMYIDAQGRSYPCCWLGNRRDQTDFASIQASWQSHTPHKICVRTCSVNNQRSQFQQQWHSEVQL